MKELIKQTARIPRKNQTESENILWQRIRNRKLLGTEFFRQHPIVFDYMDESKFFVADFYCAEKKLVIEIDGGIHDTQKEYDEFRTFIINELGMRVIRFTNKEVNTNIFEVLKLIRSFS